MNMKVLKGWVLQFDIKEALDAGIDQNPLFTRFEDITVLVENLFPQWYTLHSDLEEINDHNDLKEIFFDDVFYKLPSEYDSFSIEAICDVIREHSFWYPSDFYYDGSLYTGDIKNHRVTQWNHAQTGH